MKLSFLVKKALIIASVAAMTFGTTLCVQASIKDPDYTQSSSTWTVSGNVTARIDKGILYIEGTGAMPDYTNDTLSQRPYHTSIIGAVNVGPGITKIGERAFAEFPYLRHINVYSTTYIKNQNAFHKIDSKPQVRINGSADAVYTENGVSYSSLNSWIYLTHQQPYNIQFVVDNDTLKSQYKRDSKNFVNVQSANTYAIDAATQVAWDDFERERENKNYKYTQDPMPQINEVSPVISPAPAYGGNYYGSIGVQPSGNPVVNSQPQVNTGIVSVPSSGGGARKLSK